MGSGSPTFKVLVATWVKENVAATTAVVVWFILAAMYLQYCYAEPDTEIMRWMRHQTVNEAMGSNSTAVRLPAKYRMLNPWLLMVDYPFCRWITFGLKLKDVPGISANLISLVHPLMAVLASCMIVRAASPPPTVYTPDIDDPDFDNVPMKEDRVGNQNVLMVKAAALLFLVRNTLDTLDGVMARAQSTKKLPTGVGLNGHLLDVVTDMAGVTAFMAAVWYHYYIRRVGVAKHGVPGVREVVAKLSNAGLNPVVISRVMCFFGVAMICLTGLSWETTMLRMQAYFDETTNPNILALERQPAVQICYYLWSLTCSDTLFTYLIVALLTGVAHDFLVVLSVYGWAWLVILTLYSTYVTKWIVNHPAMASSPH